MDVVCVARGLGDAPPRLREKLSAEAASAGGTRLRPGRRLRIVVLGPGEREADLHHYAGGRGLADDEVHWLGWRPDLPRLYPAVDVLFLTSRDDGTPLAVMEALGRALAETLRRQPTLEERRSAYRSVRRCLGIHRLVSDEGRIYAEEV